MYRMKGNVVDRVDQGLILSRGSLVATVAFEGEVVRSILLLDVSGQELSSRGQPTSGEGCAEEFGTHWMATRPSMLPTAKPFALGKQETTRVCHLSGDERV